MTLQILSILSAVVTASTSPGDPITAILTRDWAAVGGWSLFVTLCMIIVVSFMRGWVVPGSMYRRLEDAATLQRETLNTTVHALDKQVTSNEIVKHFFEETTPKRREADS